MSKKKETRTPYRRIQARVSGLAYTAARRYIDSWNANTVDNIGRLNMDRFINMIILDKTKKEN